VTRRDAKDWFSIIRDMLAFVTFFLIAGALLGDLGKLPKQLSAVEKQVILGIQDIEEDLEEVNNKLDFEHQRVTNIESYLRNIDPTFQSQPIIFRRIRE